MKPVVIRSIPLANIDADDRLRPVDDSWAAAISESMAKIGLTEPVIVRADGKGFILVAGAHRFKAAQLLGWAEITAIVQDIGPLEARLVEIDENLMRRELGALDRAVFLSERKSIWEAMYPEVVHGGDRKSLKNKGGNQVANLATRFTSEAAEKVGISERSIRRSCMIADALSPEIVKLIRQTYLASHQADLDKFSRMPVDRQLEAAQRLSSGECKTLAGAFGRTERDDEEKIVQKWTAAWSNKMSMPVRRRILGFMGVDPAEIERILGRRATQAEAA